jgi:DNA-binding NtrC family response regulator
LRHGIAVATLAPTMNTTTAPPTLTISLPPRPLGYHGAVSDFKRRLIEATLKQMRGNRTHAARALGLQRTYLLRLMRELGVSAPPPGPRRPGAA